MANPESPTDSKYPKNPQTLDQVDPKFREFVTQGPGGLAIDPSKWSPETIAKISDPNMRSEFEWMRYYRTHPHAPGDITNHPIGHPPDDGGGGEAGANDPARAGFSPHHRRAFNKGAMHTTALQADERLELEKVERDIKAGTATADEIKEAQGVLKNHGFDIGKTGKNHNGIDGVAGNMTRGAMGRALSGPTV